MKALYAKVYNVKKIPSRDCVQIIIELPVHSYKEAVDIFDEEKILLTVAPMVMQKIFFDDYQIFDHVEKEKNESSDERVERAMEKAMEQEQAQWGRYYQRLFKAGFFYIDNILIAFGVDNDEIDGLKKYFYKKYNVDSLKKISPDIFYHHLIEKLDGDWIARHQWLIP